MTDHSWLADVVARLRTPDPARPAADRTPERARRRLIALLCLFDALLIAAVLLSFQTTDLIEEERTLLETRTSYEILYRDQVITQTEVITHLLPHGSVP